MSTDHGLLAMLAMLRSWQAELPTLVQFRVDSVRRELHLRAADYLDARLWLASLPGPADLNRIVTPSSGAVWWHADISLGDNPGAWTILLDAREILPESLPLADRATRRRGFVPELDDPAEALLDALETLAWDGWMSTARLVYESALQLAGPLSPAAELILDRAMPGRGSS